MRCLPTLPAYLLPCSLITTHYLLAALWPTTHGIPAPCPWLLAGLICGGHSVGLGVALSLSMAALSDRRVIQHAGTPKFLILLRGMCGVLYVCSMETTDTRDRESGAGGPAVLEESHCPPILRP